MKKLLKQIKEVREEFEKIAEIEKSLDCTLIPKARVGDLGTFKIENDKLYLRRPYDKEYAEINSYDDLKKHTPYCKD